MRKFLDRTTLWYRLPEQIDKFKDIVEMIESQEEGFIKNVNGKTGTEITVKASDVGAATSTQGQLANTAVQPGDLGALATQNSVAFADVTGKPTNYPTNWITVNGKPNFSNVATSGD